MPATDQYVEVDPSPDAHIIQDAPNNYNQQYDLPQNEYEAAVAEHDQNEHQQMQDQYLGVTQEQQDANNYVQDLIEKTSKKSESGMEEEEEEEEEEFDEEE